ncbi:DUF4214 domain-containing protein [Modestobacter sp. VKM Ac-2985]|uniref:DUF4214 domain-containing protein n=1 Tax=Modestobacter sp. VKM Ac-2985 TaxID=3004139 RepID=UPI0022AB94AD|nr:DUF4214 domain-containing protein [Modestobacter sp. VKM Ac-2985]MCZ2838588.1 DUF4214 domain-containing protein [Modestobacter sp. VKM Ac-2985]
MSACVSASVLFTGTLLILPVYAAPTAEAEPVETSSVEVTMGSVEDPSQAAAVQAGTTDPVVGVPGNAPTLTVAEPRTREFSLVGVTWDHDPAVTDTLVKVRVRSAEGTWGQWAEVAVEDADQDADADSGAERRGGSAPLWTGPSVGVEAELVTRSGRQPRDVVLDLVDPGQSDADESLTDAGAVGTAHAAMAMPEVFSRAQWGADEGIRSWDPEYARTIKAATLHHTADTNNYSAEQVPAMLRAIYRYHSVSRGWGDIGYNVIVDKYGRLWEGRYGGLNSTVIGAHAGGFNTGTFGVSMLGNYDTQRVYPSMTSSIAAIIAWKFSLYGVNPYATTTLTSGGGGTSKYPAGTQVTVPTIFGHRDVGKTACPGQYGYAQLGQVREQALAATGAAALVNGLFADVLGRTPAPGELGAWTKAVAESGDRWVAVRGTSGSVEYRQRFVAEAYETILARNPEPGAVAFWVNEMAAGRMTPDRLRSHFMLAQEFYLKGGGTDEGFVDLLYRRTFNRTASSGEQALWAGTARTAGRAEVVRGIWDSYEGALNRVDRSYLRWLSRAASPGERDYWSRTVITAGDESMREAALVSPEYVTRSQTRFP